MKHGASRFQPSPDQYMSKTVMVYIFFLSDIKYLHNIYFYILM